MGKAHTRETHQRQLDDYYVDGHIICLEYRSGGAKCSYTCTKHGTSFEARPDAVVAKPGRQGKRLGCAKCQAEYMREQYLQPVQAVQSKLDLIFGSNIWVNPETYLDQNSYADFYCYEHDFYWQAKVTDVFRATGCPVCGVIASTRAAKRVPKEYKLGQRTVVVEGYEPQALDHIQQHMGYAAKDLIVQSEGGVPTLELQDGRRCFPDIYVISERRLVEVKSPFTLRLGFEKLCLAHRAALESGYQYSLLVFAGNRVMDVKRCKLPSDWFNLSFDALEKRITYY